jgi:L-iditol 2-dehydrogenase
MSCTYYTKQYDPAKILDHPDFRILADGETVSKDVNLACAYNEKHQIHLVARPKPTPGSGEVVVKIKATGICG